MFQAGFRRVLWVMAVLGNGEHTLLLLGHGVVVGVMVVLDKAVERHE